MSTRTPLTDSEYYAARRAQINEELGRSPSSRGLKFFEGAYAAYEAEATEQEILLTHARASELLDLRFVGPQAEHGQMPMRQLLDILTPLEKALSFAAYRLRYGKTDKRVDESTRSVMGLRMAGMASGSARVLVVGDSREDMTGANLLDATLTQTFRLLTAPNDEFYDAVDAVGGLAARHFGEALHEVERHGFAAEFNVQRDDRPSLRWDGTPGEIRRVCALIATTQEPERFDQDLEGPIASLADNGSIQLRAGDEKLKVRFPLALLEQVQRLTLGQHARLHVSTAKYWDAVFKREVHKHTLLGVRPRTT